MPTQYSDGIIVLSLGVAFFGSYMAISVCELYRQYRVGISEPRLLTKGAYFLTLMAICLGGIGIWCMHFIGMGALTMYDNRGEAMVVRYDIWKTVLSLILVLIFSGLGAYISSHDDVFSKSRREIVMLFVGDAATMTMKEVQQITFWRMVWIIGVHNPTYLLLGGLFAGSGVIVMHYVGMTAMSFKGHIVWDVGIITASCIIAIIAATAAFWILFRFLSVFAQREHLRISCAATMALAVGGMHYVGMQAATFVMDDDQVIISNQESMSREQVFISGLLIVGIVGLLAVMVNLSELRRTAWKLSYELNRADETMTHLTQSTPKSAAFQIRRYFNKRKASSVGLGAINNTYAMDRDAEDDDDLVSVQTHGSHLIPLQKPTPSSAFRSPRSSVLSMQVLPGDRMMMECMEANADCEAGDIELGAPPHRGSSTVTEEGTKAPQSTRISTGSASAFQSLPSLWQENTAKMQEIDLENGQQ